MVILGLTGSIAMGKSTASAMLRRLGVPVYDADAAVHRLFARGGAAVAPVGKAFPAAIVNGAVDRKILGGLVFNDPAALKRLESIVHPLVQREEGRFLRRMAARGERLVALDIPLLFESGRIRWDKAAVVWAPPFLQVQRVLRRPGMDKARLAAIRARQMPDAEKKKRADFVVPTGLGKRETLRHLMRIVTLMRSERGRSWPPRKMIRHHGAHARNRP
jgi:dephospho-CoA kinase